MFVMNTKCEANSHKFLSDHGKGIAQLYQDFHIVSNLLSFFRCTMYSYYRTWGWRLQYDYLVNLPSYSQFRLAWLAFSQLNVIPGSLFRCDECGSEPTVIVCDGICLSYLKRYSQTSSNSVETSTTKLKGSRLVYRLNVSCMGVLGNGIIVSCSSYQFVRRYL